MKAYVYKYVNKYNNKVYIGSRSHYNCKPEEDFNVKYFSSSKDKEFRTAMKNGELEGEILFEIDCENAGKKAVELEHKMIRAFWNKYGKEMSYNHYCNGKFSVVGKDAWNKGQKGVVHLTEEHKTNISKSLKGKPKSKEHIRKAADSHKGKPKSQETKQKISETLKGHTAWNKGTNTLKHKWITETGEIREMCKCSVVRWHPNWILLES